MSRDSAALQLVAWVFLISCALCGLVALTCPLGRDRQHDLAVSAGILGILALTTAGKCRVVRDLGRDHLSRMQASSLIVGGGCLLSAVAGTLVIAADVGISRKSTRSAYLSLSLLCVTCAAATTHGLAGRIRHRTWKTYQPLVGGALFIATQAAGWILFSVSVLALLALLRLVVMAGVTGTLRLWSIGVGGALLLSQALLSVSLLLFTSPPAGKRACRPPRPQLAPLLLCYLCSHVLAASVAVSWSLLPLRAFLGGWLAVLLPYFALTTRGAPHHTGCRTWAAFRTWIGGALHACLTAWSGAVVLHARAPPPAYAAQERVIFGYHPHGLYPAGASFLPLLPAWRKRVGVEVVTLCASVIHWLPLLRDIAHWSGMRQVSRETFEGVLKTGAVLVVPGGQEELVHCWRLHANDDLVLCGRHKGFVRLAIKHQAALVPVLSLGEAHQLRNAFAWPSLQAFTYKRLGFPLPFWLVGWRLTPLPRPVPLHWVVGDPISPPPLDVAREQGEQAVLDLHRRYYGALERMFSEYKVRHPHYRKTRLIIRD